MPRVLENVQGKWQGEKMKGRNSLRDPAPRNLVKSWPTPDRKDSTTETSCLVNPQNCQRNPIEGFRKGVEARKFGCSSRQMGSFRVPIRSDQPYGASQISRLITCETDLAGSHGQPAPFTEALCGRSRTRTRPKLLNPMPRGSKSAARDDFDPVEQDLERPQAVGCPQTYLKRPSWFHGSWTERLQVSPLSK